jgi:hypothetical protein
VENLQGEIPDGRSERPAVRDFSAAANLFSCESSIFSIDKVDQNCEAHQEFIAKSTIRTQSFKGVHFQISREASSTSRYAADDFPLRHNVHVLLWLFDVAPITCPEQVCHINARPENHLLYSADSIRDYSVDAFLRTSQLLQP